MAVSGADAVPNASSSFKWQIALAAVGVTGAAGLFWYYKSYKAPNNGDSYDRSPNSICKSKENDSVLKATVEPAGDKSPFQKAIVFKEEGNKHFKCGRYPEALKCYQDAIDIGSDVDNITMAIFYQNKAAVHEHLKEYEGVKQDCSMALTLNPQYTKALLRRAKANEALKELPKALQDITAACILENFEVQTTLMNADRILKELGRVHAKEAIAKKKRVMPSPFFVKTYFAAFTKDPLHEYLADKTNDTSKGFLKAIDCLRRGEYDSIISACTEELIQTEAEATLKNEALVLRGTIYNLIGEHNAALADLDAVIENPDASAALRVNALVKRASIHMQLEDTTKCMEDFTRAVTIDCNNPDIYHQRGQVNLLMERLNEAQNDFEAAVNLNPHNPITIVQKCYTDYRVCLAKNDEASLHHVMARFEEYIRDYATCPECFTLYAQVLSDRQECEKADKLYEKAIKLDPGNAALLVHRAILSLQWTGDVEAAIKLINEALSVDEKCGFACETLGTIQVQRGNLKDAIKMFDKAIEFAKTELELAHLYSLRDASIAQQNVFQEMNLRLPNTLSVSS